MSEFVIPGVKRLDLAGEGRWIEVRAEIGIRDQKRIESALFRGVQGAGQQMIGRPDVTSADVELMLDGTLAFMVKLEIYLVDWSFRDAADKPVKVSTDAIAALRPETAEEILAVLNQYLDEQEKERKASPFGKKTSRSRSA